MVASKPPAVSAAERRLARAFAAGQAADLRAGPDDELQNVSSWGPERQVRAEMIAGLLAGDAKARAGSVPGSGSDPIKTKTVNGKTIYWFRVSAGKDATGKRVQVYKSFDTSGHASDILLTTAFVLGGAR